jgi:hypothetical protein
LQRLLLEIDIAEIILDKTDKPSTFFDLFKAKGLPCENGADVDLFTV